MIVISRWIKQVEEIILVAIDSYESVLTLERNFLTFKFDNVKVFTRRESLSSLRSWNKSGLSNGHARCKSNCDEDNCI